MTKIEPLRPMPENKGDITEVAKGVLETLLTKMGIAATVVLRTQPLVGEDETVAPIAFDIEGDDFGVLIGRRGQTLSCLQYIVRLIIFNQTKTWVPVIIDVEGYRQRRSEALQDLACRIADQVKAKGVPFTLEPMPAYERRIIHLTLADHPDVITQSTGEGEARKVVISPK
jgi:spoIIIJ-associated protein